MKSPRSEEKSERSDSRIGVWGTRVAVKLEAPDGSSALFALCRLIAANPGTFSEQDVTSLRCWRSITKLGCKVTMTSDSLCVLCDAVIGKGSMKCHACEHRDEGPGYRAGVSRPG